MGGSPSIQAPPPPPPAPPPPPTPVAPQQPDPAEVANASAEAYSKFYKNALNEYIGRLPDIVRTDTELRVKYAPTQRALERQLASLDQQASVQSNLQLERQYGGQRTLEGLRRQYETSPAAFALNRALGDQYSRQFQQLYGASPFGSVPANVSNPQTVAPFDYYATVGTGMNPVIGG